MTIFYLSRQVSKQWLAQPEVFLFPNHMNLGLRMLNFSYPGQIFEISTGSSKATLGCQCAEELGWKSKQVSWAPRIFSVFLSIPNACLLPKHTQRPSSERRPKFHSPRSNVWNLKQQQVGDQLVWIVRGQLIADVRSSGGELPEWANKLGVYKPQVKPNWPPLYFQNSTEQLAVFLINYVQPQPQPKSVQHPSYCNRTSNCWSFR